MPNSRRQMIFRLLLLIIVLPTLAACSGFKNGVYEAAMGLECRRAQLEPATVTIDEFEIAVLESRGAGGAPTLVLVHGFGASKEVWLRFARQLAHDFHVIALDLPGHGDSAKPMDKNYSVPHQVSYLHDILAEMGVKAPHLVGNSMGGALAALYAARYPESVASIALFDPAGVHTHESELMQQLARGENPLIVEKPGDYRRMLDFTMEQPPFLFWPISSVLAEKAMANRPINEKIFNDIRADTELRVEAVLSSIRAPALIVWGRHDRVINVENGRVFDELIPDSRLVILEDVGHAPMLESPKRSAALVEDFVLSAAGR